MGRSTELLVTADSGRPTLLPAALADSYRAQLCISHVPLWACASMLRCRGTSQSIQRQHSVAQNDEHLALEHAWMCAELLPFTMALTTAAVVVEV